MFKKIITPRSVLIEKVASSLAASWFEVGKSQGLTSKHKTAKAYAAANLEKFIPKAVDTLLEMLKPTSNCTAEMREEIYCALLERHNDPELQSVLPNIDVNKVIELANLKERSKIVEINMDKTQKLRDPGKAIRH
ncbi:MAG: hypothetical protein AABY22_27980 [Nanoarchaeota archaeon]